MDTGPLCAVFIASTHVRSSQCHAASVLDGGLLFPLSLLGPIDEQNVCASPVEKSGGKLPAIGNSRVVLRYLLLECLQNVDVEMHLCR